MKFFSLMNHAVNSLPVPTKEARSDLYLHARKTLIDHLCTGEEQVTKDELEHEKAALDAAIAQVELEFLLNNHESSVNELGYDFFSDSTDNYVDRHVSDGSDRRQFALNATLSGAVNLLKTVLQLFLLPVMAHLLGPKQYGVYSLAFPTVVFFVMITDGGFGLSLSREDENNRVVWSTAFWTLLALCSFMSLGVIASGVVLAQISGEPSLIPIMIFLSIVLPLVAISVPADARLMRRGNGVYHSASDFFGTIVGAGVALALAVKGAGAWALAAQYVTSFSIRAIIINAAAWSTPDFTFDIRSLRGHFSTSGGLLVTRLGELGVKLAENSLFGHIFGTTTLGSYMLANQVSRFTCEAISNPMVGSFYIQSLRENDIETAKLHAKLTRLVLLVLFPLTTLMAVAAPDMFPLVLGPRWLEAAPLFQSIVVAYALTATAWLSAQILLKHGMTGRSAKVVLCCGAVRVTAVTTGLWFPPVVVACLVGATYLLQAAAMTLAVPDGLGASLGSIVSKTFVPAISAVLGAGASAYVVSQYPGNVGSAVSASALGGLIYLTLLLTLEGKELYTDILALTRMLRRKSPESETQEL